MRERGPVRPAPRLINVSERNQGRGKFTVVKCPPRHEVQVKKIGSSTLYRLIPQAALSQESFQLGLSLVEEGQIVASAAQEIVGDKNYRLENTRIIIALSKLRDHEEFSIRIKAPGYNILKEAQPLSARKYK